VTYRALLALLAEAELRPDLWYLRLPWEPMAPRPLVLRWLCSPAAPWCASANYLPPDGCCPLCGRPASDEPVAGCPAHLV
jgi:hypothetical protein